MTTKSLNLFQSTTYQYQFINSSNESIKLYVFFQTNYFSIFQIVILFLALLLPLVSYRFFKSLQTTARTSLGFVICFIMNKVSHLYIAASLQNSCYILIRIPICLSWHYIFISFLSLLFISLLPIFIIFSWNILSTQKGLFITDTSHILSAAVVANPSN